MLLVTYILVCINILNVWGENISFSSPIFTDFVNYDITVIYRITNYSNKFPYFKDGFLDLYPDYKEYLTTNVYSRTNAIGIPLNWNAKRKYFEIPRKNTSELLIDKSFEYNTLDITYKRDYWIHKYITLNGQSCGDIEDTFIDNLFIIQNRTLRNQDIQFNACYIASIYTFSINQYLSYDNNNLYSTNSLFKLQWAPKHEQTCLTITYILKTDSKIGTKVIFMNEYGALTSIDLKKKDELQSLNINNIILMKDHTYTLSIEIYMTNHNYHNIQNTKYYQFGLIQIAGCSDQENNLTYDNERTLNKPCLNDGFQHPMNSTECICPPGFIGEFCEKGCGPNAYGADCTGVCSMHWDKMCRGSLMCTNYGCTCPAGLTGPWCDKDCSPGKYGNDCKQNCSSNCLDNICDQYTGVCIRGCSPGFALPLCREKYAYLINPPLLIASAYSTLEISLDFQLKNIKGGNKNRKLDYYQLFYRSLNANNFTKSEMKSITDNETSIEFLSDLESDTIYMVGVLVITDDGNYNDQDIVYGEYKTLCIQPQTTDYNVKLKSGMKNVNVTWNNIILKPFECNIIEWNLKLTCEEPQIPDVQEIISTTNNGHVIDNLNPGYQYKLTLTPKTSKGLLQSSPTYEFTTLITNNDVRIKDIDTTIGNNKIKVTWNLQNSNFYKAIVNEPVTCIIRYKVNRIYSCSLNEVVNDWTSILLFNQTNFEITNVVPNSQYIIQVLIPDTDKNNTYQFNTVYILTPSSTPKTVPVLDSENPMYITNNSVFVQWKFDQEKCSMINGFFSKFYIELKNKSNSQLQIKETKENYVVFDDLRPHTNYEMKIFIKNNIDYNSEHFLIVNITTKSENLPLVDDLVVYKKSSKNRMVGLRWSYIENTNIDGFIVSFNEDDLIKTKNESIIPLNKCTAWPEYYCHTFYHLSPNNNKFKIRPRSIDYPKGGEVSSISLNIIDGLPDSPSNLKYTEISNTTIGLQWDIPWIFNGELNKFIINAEEVSSIDIDTCCESITSKDIKFDKELPTYNYTLKDLKPGSTYSIGVLTVSKSQWYSSPTRISVTTILVL